MSRSTVKPVSSPTSSPKDTVVSSTATVTVSQLLDFMDTHKETLGIVGKMSPSELLEAVARIRFGKGSIIVLYDSGNHRSGFPLHIRPARWLCAWLWEFQMGAKAVGFLNAPVGNCGRQQAYDSRDRIEFLLQETQFPDGTQRARSIPGANCRRTVRAHRPLHLSRRQDFRLLSRTVQGVQACLTL